MSLSIGNQEFSKVRSFFWPVHTFELKKLVPMLLIFFLISFDYNILRTMKDTLLVTAEGSGAEAIPFVKVWAMLPGAVLFTWLFTRLSNRYSREQVFYIMMSIFLGYYALFITVLYPARDLIQPTDLAEAMQSALPLGCKGFIAMFRNWVITSFYAISELWSNIVLFLLFWGFANQITKLGEAKRFYGLFGMGANVSGIFAGQASVWLSSLPYNPSIPIGNTGWEQSMTFLISLVLLSGLCVIALFRWLHLYILTDPRYYDPSQTASKAETPKLTLRESIRYLLRSRYLCYIAIIVLGYNVVINLVEVLWKHQVRELYPDPVTYNIYMNQVSTIIAIIATLSAVFISGNSIRRFGWTFTAMLTPVILLLSSIGFFSFFFCKGPLEGISMALFGVTPLAIVVFFGSAQNVICRAAKYSVFDTSREMAFVPLNHEGKMRGKAVIDGVCSRLGKSGGSFIHQSLLLTFSTLTASAPYVAAILLGTVLLWTLATRLLGKEFNALIQKQGKTALDEADAAATTLVPAAAAASTLQEEPLSWRPKIIELSQAT